MHPQRWARLVSQAVTAGLWVWRPDGNGNPSQGEGIPNSLAIEFDTYQNGWDPQAVNGNVSHVAIQSCGTGPNTSHHTTVATIAVTARPSALRLVWLTSRTVQCIA